MRLLIPAVAVFSLIACGDLSDPKVCTANFVIVQVVVTDSQGTLLDGLSHRTVHFKTGSRVVLDSIHASGHFPGSYVVITDNERHLVSEEGDELGFVAWDEDWVATATFVVGFDGCHIVKRAGPDTVIAF